jgi:hypothetical protein
MWAKWNYTYASTLKFRYILKVKNASVRSVSAVFQICKVQSVVYFGNVLCLTAQILLKEHANGFRI